MVETTKEMALRGYPAGVMETRRAGIFLKPWKKSGNYLDEDLRFIGFV